MNVFHRTRFFPRIRLHIWFYMWISKQDTLFYPGYVFYKWAFLHRARSIPEYIFYKCVFLQMSFFLQSVFFPRSFLLAGFFTPEFFTQYTTHLSRPGFFLHVVFFHKACCSRISRLHIRLLQRNSLHKISFPRGDSLCTIGSITKRFVDVIIGHALFLDISSHICFFYKWVFLQSVCFLRSPFTGRFSYT